MLLFEGISHCKSVMDAGPGDINGLNRLVSNTDEFRCFWICSLTSNNFNWIESLDRVIFTIIIITYQYYWLIIYLLTIFEPPLKIVQKRKREKDLQSIKAGNQIK